MKNISLSSVSNIPIYRQLYDQIVAQIYKGDLQADMSLPSIRVAAKELKISVITVKKAWEDLEREGYIYTIPGKGSYVANLSEQSLEKKIGNLLYEELYNQMVYFKELGIQKSQLSELIQKIYDE